MRRRIVDLAWNYRDYQTIVVMCIQEHDFEGLEHFQVSSV